MAIPITVYWTCYEEEWMRALPPEKISKKFHSYKIRSDNWQSPIAVNYCPASNRALENIYSIKSLYDYSFTIKDNQCSSSLYDQNFYNEHVNVRSIEQKVFSFNNRYAFFTDEKSLEITAYEYPTFEQNEVSRRCIPISGKYDIGKWFRPLEFPFILKDEFDTFTVKEQDVLYYLRVHTNRPIVFKQFILTDTLRGMLNSAVKITSHKIDRFKTLESFYHMFKSKKYILKEIKKSLI